MTAFEFYPGISPAKPSHLVVFRDGRQTPYVHGWPYVHEGEDSWWVIVPASGHAGPAIARKGRTWAYADDAAWRERNLLHEDGVSVRETALGFAERIRDQILDPGSIPDVPESAMGDGPIVASSTFGKVVFLDKIEGPDGSEEYARAVMVGRSPELPKPLPWATGLLDTEGSLPDWLLEQYAGSTTPEMENLRLYARPIDETGMEEVAGWFRSLGYRTQVVDYGYPSKWLEWKGHGMEGAVLDRGRGYGWTVVAYHAGSINKIWRIFEADAAFPVPRSRSVLRKWLARAKEICAAKRAVDTHATESVCKLRRLQRRKAPAFVHEVCFVDAGEDFRFFRTRARAMREVRRLRLAQPNREIALCRREVVPENWSPRRRFIGNTGEFMLKRFSSEFTLFLAGEERPRRGYWEKDTSSTYDESGE